MINTYFQVALRNLTKDTFYSAINVLGLTVGLTCFILIYLFVQHELSFDKYYKDSERTYRVASNGSFGGSDFDIAVVGAPTGEAMLNDYPEVEDYFRFRSIGSILFRSGENYYKEERVVFADANFFDFFSQKMIKGNAATALAKPYNITLNEEIAQKVFGDADPIGEVVEFDDGVKYEVTGVFEKIPDNTHFQFDVILSLESLEESRLPIWVNQNFQTYIRVSPGTDIENFERKIQGMVEKYMGPEVLKFLGKSLEEFKEQGNSIAFYLQPVADIHLRSNLVAELQPNGDIRYVYIFSAIGIFILLIACINYMNLATARSSGRAKEVGIRKVMGAHKPQLILQFVIESILITLFAAILAIILGYWLIPFYNDIAGKSFDPEMFESIKLISLLLAVTIVVGVLAGSYPAFFLTAFAPITVLRSHLSTGMKSSLLRNVLVIVQFSISIFLIVGTLVIFDQLSFIQNKSLGFEKEHKIILHNTSSLNGSAQTFKEEVLNDRNFASASISSYLPSPSSRSQSAVFKGNDPAAGTSSMQIWVTDHDFIKTLGMNILSGRDFSKDHASDSTTVIINQSAVKRFEFDEPLGQEIGFYTGSEGSEDSDRSTFKVIGVIEDFHFNSLKQNISPLIIVLGKSQNFITFKLNGSDYPQALSALESKWNEFAPGYPFEYTFLDDALNEVYSNELKMGKIFAIFSSIAIVIACLGLFALSSFTAEQRSKEIGIRKVLGASVTGIMALLSREFIKLMLVSFIIAAPLAYWSMNSWLEDFAYRTDVHFITFIIAGLGSFAIAWATLSFQALRAARANPVNTLRDE